MFPIHFFNDLFVEVNRIQFIIHIHEQIQYIKKKEMKCLEKLGMSSLSNSIPLIALSDEHINSLIKLKLNNKTKNNNFLENHKIYTYIDNSVI